MSIGNREPAAIIGIVVSCVLAVISVLSAQGVLNEALTGKLTDGVNAVAQLLVLLAPIITGLLIRTQVTPTAAPALPEGTTVQVITPEGRPNTRTTL